MTVCEQACWWVATRQTVRYIERTAGEARRNHRQTMTFTVSGNTKQYGPERWEFTPVSDDKNNPKAVKMTRWVTAPNEGWYVIWQGYHFLGNARIMWRDRIAQGWAAG